MIYAVLICSDAECAEEFEAYDALDLDHLVCDCGCTLQVISIDEAEPAELIVDLPLAA